MAGRHRSEVAAVIVDYDVGEPLAGCLQSLRHEGVEQVVVVENGESAPVRTAIGRAAPDVELLAPGRNLGYGAGANRGAATCGESPRYLLIGNADLVVHPGAVEQLAGALDADPSMAVVGPRILTPDGERYPSARRFPSMLDAVGHALLGLLRPDNPFTRRYRQGTASEAEGVDGPAEVDWVSGACFMIRRAAFEELGGFDESYFMYAEDMDLCWRAQRRGWGVAIVPSARVTHLQGVSTDRRPYRMLVAHHRSAWRFARRTTTGWRRLALPGAAVVLGARLGANVAVRLVRGSAPR